MLRQKSTCLDTDEPRAQKMPHLSRTNWKMRSDVEYDQENMNHPIKVTEGLDAVELTVRQPVEKLPGRANSLAGVQSSNYKMYGKRTISIK